MFSCKGKQWKIFSCRPALSSDLEPQMRKFHVVWETKWKKCTEKRAVRAARLSSSFNQSNHWFLALTLPLLSSFLRNHSVIRPLTQLWTRVYFARLHDNVFHHVLVKDLSKYARTTGPRFHTAWLRRIKTRETTHCPLRRLVIEIGLSGVQFGL